MTRADAAARGGKATLAKYGKVHMAAIGRKGYEAALSRYFARDRLQFRMWLAARA